MGFRFISRAHLVTRSPNVGYYLERTRLQSNPGRRACILVGGNRNIRPMAKNLRSEQTSRRVATIASNALRGNPVTRAQVKTLAASVLTQAPNKKKTR